MNRFCTSLVLAALCLNANVNLFAQASPRPHRGPLPTTDFEQFAVYWTAEAGWKTELLLRNNLPSQTLTVTPALRTADGRETALPGEFFLPTRRDGFKLRNETIMRRRIK